MPRVRCWASRPRSVPVKASYSVNRTNAAGSPEARKLALDYVHNLSKHTALYAAAARANP